MKPAVCAAIASVVLSACGGTNIPVTRAQPVFSAGHYYMMGDANCPNYRQLIGQSSVLCHDASGQPTGEYRAAMTDQQLQMWQFNQQMAAQRQAQRNAEAAAFNRQLIANAQAMSQTQQYAPTYTAPQLAPVSLSSPTVVSCISVSEGFYTNCRW